ncbi:MAG: hypothetical protein ACRDRH_26860 [Pseudonocardia sp.]
METTNATETTNTTGWWTCSDCGTDAELPDHDTATFRVACPDCAGTMAEQWRWETTAA